MKAKIFFVCVLSCLFLTDMLFGQEKIYFNFDYCIFKAEGTNSYLEIYYSINQKSLIYTPKDGNFEALVKIDIKLTDVSNNSPVIDKTFKSPSVVTDTTENILNKNIIGQINFLLSDGRYALKITGSDFNNESLTDVFESEFSVENNSVSELTISNIELSTNIQKSSNEASNFYKNTLEVLPNPSGLFGMDLENLYFYHEIYGLNSSSSDELILNYSVTNLNNEVLYTFDKKIKKNSEARVEYGKIKVDTLDRGSYFLKINITDNNNTVLASGEKKFFIFNVSENIAPKSPQDDFLLSEYAVKSEKELNMEFEYAKYLMTERQIDRYEDLKNIDEKRRFVYEFWKSKDNIPGTKINEYKIDYLKRVNEANRNFKEAYNDGWKTDRGRIYLVYGKPDDIERYPFESTKKSYEIWKYDSVEGGGECVFIEKQPATSVYWLVHSTFKSELKNPEWEKELRP